MKKRVNSATLAPLIEVARTDPDPAVRRAAFDTASRLTLSEEAWRALAGAVTAAAREFSSHAPERSAVLVLAARVPLLSTRCALRAIAADPDDPAGAAVSDALVLAGDASQADRLLADAASGQWEAFEGLATMPLERVGVSLSRLPLSPAEPSSPARLWHALAAARLGEYRWLDRFLTGQESEPTIFYGSPAAPYSQIAAMRPLPDALHTHLMAMLPRAARIADPARQRMALIVVWAATGSADADGSAFGDPADEDPAPPTRREIDAALTAARAQLGPIATGRFVIPDPVADVEVGQVVGRMLADAQAWADALPADAPVHQVIGNAVINLVGSLPRTGDWPLVALVQNQLRAARPVLDDEQLAWVIARTPPSRWIKQFVSMLVPPERPSAERLQVLRIASACADHFAGRGLSPQRGAGRSAAGAPSGRGELIEDEVPAASSSRALAHGDFMDLLSLDFGPLVVEHPTRSTPPDAGLQAVPGASPARFFNARMPDRVALNAQTYVIVQVAGEAAQPAVGDAVAHASVGDFIGELTIDVHAPGLKASGPTTLTLQVPARGDSARLRFGFVAHKAGLHQVDVMAWNGSAQVAGLTLQIAVEIDAVTEGTNEATGDMDMREPETGEYTLDVAMEDETKRYRFQLRSDQKDVWPPMYSEPLLNARQQTYSATMANLNAQARNLYRLEPKDQAIWLRGMGNLLFEQLVPDKLKALLIEHKSKIRVLNILSEVDATPWELLFIADPDTGEGDFLATSTKVARWRYGAGPGRSLRRANKVLVLPADAPPQAKAELQALQEMLGGAATIGDLRSLNTLMATGGFDLLHFAAHHVNVPGAQGGAYIPFGPQRWDLTFIAAVPRNKFKAHAPLIFMNACTTSGTTELYTELAGWADGFLRCGSGAFIGTLWEVRDSSAQKFSGTFYKELLSGQTLGDAMQAARNRLRIENPGDPTPLAYTLYGNPLARMEQA